MLLNNGTNFVSLNKVYSSTDIVLISWLQDPRMNSKFHCTNFVANSIESFLVFLCCFFDEILKMTKKLLTTRKIEIRNSILDPLKRVKINMYLQSQPYIHPFWHQITYHNINMYFLKFIFYRKSTQWHSKIYVSWLSLTWAITIWPIWSQRPFLETKGCKLWHCLTTKSLVLHPTYFPCSNTWKLLTCHITLLVNIYFSSNKLSGS